MKMRRKGQVYEFPCWKMWLSYKFNTEKQDLTTLLTTTHVSKHTKWERTQSIATGNP